MNRYEIRNPINLLVENFYMNIYVKSADFI